MFQREAGIKMNHVPYRGAGQIATDVLGGHLATGVVSLAGCWAALDYVAWNQAVLKNVQAPP